ncbi:hypothetical protein SODALDRAFT_142862 [Sodiomyces alkalinus F11]|uniref:Uncharacterized protein n=1 Tax=Sodiomyces alkalinus (strain CBS 110278 / VKM F-3762 / F11) TaxID=1314773 RepID=A0A3N2PZW4_SODAK|nr:hypothetical protein SODALDRAFT_142862 [Sodiomyces alkalinus F11]ROT39978.1 hypothetical protein SODALDRAFT_142862 [Sodiomyces alkalinus F11]
MAPLSLVLVPTACSLPVCFRPNHVGRSTSEPGPTRGSAIIRFQTLPRVQPIRLLYRRHFLSTTHPILASPVIASTSPHPIRRTDRGLSSVALAPGGGNPSTPSGSVF